MSLVTERYPKRLADRVGEAAAAANALWLPRGGEWDAAVREGRLAYRDEAGALDLPLPRLSGAHQAMNAVLAVAMVRHQRAADVGEPALVAAMGCADWPARLQRLEAGPLHDILPRGSELWLDGGHNPAAARAIADFFHRRVPAERPFHIVLGMLANKDVENVLAPFATRRISVQGIPVAGHPHHSPAEITAIARTMGLQAEGAEGAEGALRAIAAGAAPGGPPAVLILGSLYLAGEVLWKNEQPPT